MTLFNLKRAIFLATSLCLPILITAQSWTIKESGMIPRTGMQDIVVEDADIYFVDDAIIKGILWNTPLRGTSSKSGQIISLPLLDGKMDRFEVIQYPIMEEPLAKKYTDIRAFYGQSISNPYRRVVLDYTVHGLRAVITDEDGQLFLDHYQRGDKNHKILYRRSQFSEDDGWTCDTHSKTINVDLEDQNRRSVGDCVFKTYRLAQACTGEYSNYHGAFSVNDSALVMSAVTTTMNRVNGVYRQDVNLEMILVANTDLLFYYNPSTDPYSGSSVNHLGQNQSNCDNVIGSANYDIGHVFDTGGGGVASLRSVCNNSSKARGYTGRNTPVGDPFDIDYVAHEMGHQYGGNHTQNNGCNRVSSAAFEPGSASTIMGYAGICSPNVQNNSDPYFHAYSMLEMANHIGNISCHNTVTTGNGEPVISNLANKTIPRSTPFVLETNVTDPDGDPLLYCWEQWDNEVGNMPPQSSNTQGPMFRSLNPSSNPKRYFPSINNIVNNTSNTWEVLPSVTRNMEFRLTVRDMPMTGSCSDEVNVSVNTTNNAGPFQVTSDNTSSTYQEGAQVTVTWNVANTNNAPVSCSNVDILLSYDGGFTYTTTWIANTPNDGTETLTVPSGTSNSVRYMVKCTDNYFFDINNQDISIMPIPPDFEFVLSPDGDFGCGDDTFNLILNSSAIGAFTDNITLSFSNTPPSTNINFSTNPLPVGSSTAVTVTNSNTLPGTYNLDIIGQGGGITNTINFRMVIEPTSDIPDNLEPSNGENYVQLLPTLKWTSEADALSYDYEVSTLPNGGNVVESGNTTDTTIVLVNPLERATNYFWRVRSLSSCGPSNWSPEFKFSTENCFSVLADDLPIIISDITPSFVTSTISIEENRPILDLNLIDISGDHDNVGNLNFMFTAPDGSVDVVLRSICSGSQDFDLLLDNEAANNNYPCPPTDGQSYLPFSSFDNVYGIMSRGDYSISIEDATATDGGSFNTWGLDFCLSTDCDLTVSNTNPSGIGSLQAAIDCALNGDTIFLDASFINQTFSVPSEGYFIDKNITIEATGTNIKLEGNTSVFNLGANAELSLINFEVESDDLLTATIINNGALKLNNMTIINLSGESLLNQSGELEVLGSTNVD